MTIFNEDRLSLFNKLREAIGFRSPSSIIDGAVDARAIRAGAIETDKLAANSVTAEKVQAGSISTDKIEVGAVGEAQLADGAVSTPKITDDAVNSNKIAANAVGTTKISDGAITTDKLSANAVTADKLEANAVTTDKLSANAVTADKILANSITADKLEAILVLASRFIAGQTNGARIEFGVNPDTGAAFMTVYRADSQTITFEVDGDTGGVFIRGTIAFGDGLLNPDGSVTLPGQPVGTLTPVLVQKRFWALSSASDNLTSSGTVNWLANTQKGNLLLAHVVVRHSTTSVPAINTPSGWTLVGTSQTAGHERMCVFKRENSPSLNDFIVTTAAGVSAMSVRLIELYGCSVVENTAGNSGTSGTIGTGTPAYTADGVALVFAGWDGVPQGIVSGGTGYDRISTGASPDGSPNPDKAGGSAWMKTYTGSGTLGAVTFGGDANGASARAVTIKATVQTLAEVASPGTGLVRAYAKTFGSGASRFAYKDDAGIEHIIRGPAQALRDSYWSYDECFMSGVVTSNGQYGTFSWVGTGTGAQISGAATVTTDQDRHPGIYELDTGTTTTGSSRLIGGTPIRLGNGRIRIGAVVAIPTLSNSTNRFSVGLALSDQNDPVAAAGNKVGIVYSDNVNSGKWQGRTNDGGTNQTVDLGVAVVANTWYFIEAEVNADGTQADFYIDGVLAGSLTTGLQTTVSMAMRFVILKSAGTAARQVDVDLLSIYGTFTTGR